MLTTEAEFPCAGTCSAWPGMHGAASDGAAEEPADSVYDGAIVGISRETLKREWAVRKVAQEFKASAGQLAELAINGKPLMMGAMRIFAMAFAVRRPHSGMRTHTHGLHSHMWRSTYCSSTRVHSE